MSNGTVNLSPLWSAITSLEKAINSEISDRIRSDENLRNQLEKFYKELKGDIMALERNLAELIQTVNSNFINFNNKLGTLIQETNANREELKSGNVKIVKGLNDVQETSDQGLKKVSSGVAIVDVLKAMSEAQQSGTSIVRALTEIQTRLNQAEVAVMEKKKEYDRHFEKISEGYEKQLKIIGQHITQIIEKVIPILDELDLDDFTADKLATVIEEAQAVVVDHRTEILNQQRKKLNLQGLAKVKTLRLKLEEFLSDKNSIRVELDPNSKVEVPLINIPIYISVTEHTEYSSNGNDDFHSFALNSFVKDCYTKPEPKPEYFSLFNHLRSVSSNITKDKGTNLDDKTTSEIKKALLKIAKSGLIKEEDTVQVQKHLEKYPIKWLEF